MNWTFEGNDVTEIPEGYIGFVYCITCSINGKKYIGKKLFTFARTKVKTITLKNGEKRKKKIRDRVDSDWMEYYGSSDYLKKDIELLGIENFNREILYICKTKDECTYRESEEIFKRQALLTEAYYNAWIACKTRKSNVIGKIPFKE